MRVTAPSSWPWIDHSVSGLHPATETPYSDSVSLRLPYSVKLATECKSLTHYTKGTQSPHKGGSHCLYACGFRIYFTPLPGFFSPFPHGTGSLSVDHEYLALEDGPPMFRQGFSCPALLVVTVVPHTGFHIRDYHRLWLLFPKHSTNLISCHFVVLQPPICRNILGLGSSAFARHYLRNHYYFLLLWVLRCFSSPRSLNLTVMIQLLCTGLPHSEIYGSIDICSSP